MKSNGITVGISISEPDKDELGKLGLGLLHLQDAMVEVARFLLSKGYNLAYGGDLNYDGPFNFANLLFQLGMTYGGLENRITNYSAFPMYTRISQKRKAELVNVAKIVPVNPPSQEFDKWLSISYEEATSEEKQYLDEIFEGTTARARQVWAESLTAMRKKMTREIQCRIVIGGKTQNYKGSMPGIIEETLLCIENNVTVIIDGSFGGASMQLILAIKNQKFNNDNRMKKLSEGSHIQIGKTKVMIQSKQSFDDLSNFFKLS